MYVRGQIGQDLDTRESVGIGDVEAQAEQAMANIEMLLRGGRRSAGAPGQADVYLVDPRYREPVYRTIGRWTKGVHPISTGLVVCALARPEWLVEIDAIAVHPGGGRMTFSVLAADGNGAIGIAITSSSPAVAARCIHLARRRRRRGFAEHHGPTAGDAAPGRAARPATALARPSTKVVRNNRAGRVPPAAPSSTSAAKALPSRGPRLLAFITTGSARASSPRATCSPGPRSSTAIIEAFDSSAGELEERLLGGAHAGLEAGGEAGPVHSAGLAVVREVSWRGTDLRVDWVSSRSPTCVSS